MAFAASFSLLAVLCGMAVLAAFSVVRRFDLQEGAEEALAAYVVWHALVLFPIHALGAAGHLTATKLAVASVTIDIAAFFVSSMGRDFRTHALETGRAMRACGKRALSCVVDCFRSGPVAIAALALLVAVFVWLLPLAWMRPSDTWDGIWYHDLMVGYAIQNHSYAAMDLPMGFIQQANGYPRNCEMTSLWFVIFTDRRLIELPSILAAIPVVLATALLCRRFGGDGVASRVTALVFGVGMLLVPGFRLELCTTYVDTQVMAYQLTALYFCTRREVGIPGASIAVLALALLLGSKGIALLTVPPLALYLLVRVVATEGLARWRSVAAYVTCGVFALATLGGHAYILNWIHFKNPLWPLTVSALGGKIAFSGPIGMLDSMLRDQQDVRDVLFAFPGTSPDYVDKPRAGYGLLTGYLLLPLAAFAIVVAMLRALRAGVDMVRRGPRSFGRLSSSDADVVHLLVVGAVTAIGLRYSPALWAARYNAHGVAVAMVFVHWLGQRVWRMSSLGDACAAATLVANTVMWQWSSPGWGTAWPEMKQLAAATPVDRTGMAPVLVPAMTKARETELRRGDVTLWTDDCPFPSLLWNERFDNRVVYQPAKSGTEYVDAAEANGARWIAVGTHTPAYGVVRGRPLLWTEVGLLHAHRESPSMVFRRR